MLQIRIANFDGSDPIILDRASNRRYAKSLNFDNEGISFEIAKNNEKAESVNPYTDGYIKRWEVWDTTDNKMLNFGPIIDIADNGGTWKITGAGRSALMADLSQTLKSFYTNLTSIINNVRYENIAVEPRTTTLVPSVTDSSEQDTVFGGTVIINEKYHALSENSKNNAIDDDSGLVRLGQIEPPNTFYSSDSFWSGMSTADSHIVDLGDNYPISKLVHVMPYWGGPRRFNNRAYDFSVAVASDEGSTTELQEREFGVFTTVYTSDSPNHVIFTPTAPLIIHIGMNGASIESLVEEGTKGNLSLDLPPVSVRYIRTQITAVRAWSGTHFDDEPSEDIWDYECDPDYTDGAMQGKPINDRVIEPPNDCHAGILEIGAMQEIVPLDDFEPLVLQRIDNNNFQITYNHQVESWETKTTSSGYRKFEPGSLFRKAYVTYSGASTTYTKFFDDDCTGCYPDGFNFGVMDQGNSLVLAVDNSSQTDRLIKTGAYTKHLIMKGASNAVITACDAWRARVDQFSFGGSYSYTEVDGDTAVVHFRGKSFKWYATIPASKTGATVSVQIREKTTGSWSSYSTLATFQLPSGVTAFPVYEIPYGNPTLELDTTYEIKITNTDGGFCSIDSIEGYWEGSMVEYNEDSSRIYIGNPTRIKQIYDKRFSNGSMYKYERQNFASMGFIGDRVIVTSARGRNHGKVRIRLVDQSEANFYDPGTEHHVFIPGGDPSDGSLMIDLDTGKAGNEITQYVLFDSNDYFTGGLPWGQYGIGVYYLATDLEQYTSTTADVEFDSFVSRCKECDPPSGDPITVFKPVYLDSIFVHEATALSVIFENEKKLDILKSVVDTIHAEASIDAHGLDLKPRLGEDTDIYLREGENTLVDWQIVSDVSQMATMLVSNGADIDGLPLFTITEDKKTRERVGRTIMRQQDFRNIGSYFQLVGASRAELRKRAYPERRVTVSHISNTLDLEVGDSFVLWTKKSGIVRVRIERLEIDESRGRQYNMECVTWPQMV